MRAAIENITNLFVLYILSVENFYERLKKSNGPKIPTERSYAIL